MSDVSRRARETAPPTADSDGDGITDDRDACPHEAGVASDEPMSNGCVQLLDAPPIVDRLPMLVFFRGASSIIPHENDAWIDDVVATLRQTTRSNCVVLIGHASSDEDAAQRLSEERAKAVLARIILAGIDRKHLVAMGKGASTPRTETPEGNRFVEFQVIESEASGVCP